MKITDTLKGGMLQQYLFSLLTYRPPEKVYKAKEQLLKQKYK